VRRFIFCERVGHRVVRQWQSIANDTSLPACLPACLKIIESLDSPCEAYGAVVNQVTAPSEMVIIHHEALPACLNKGLGNWAGFVKNVCAVVHRVVHCEDF
jgi:hypothetical protein